MEKGVYRVDVTKQQFVFSAAHFICLLYTSDAADE